MVENDLIKGFFEEESSRWCRDVTTHRQCCIHRTTILMTTKYYPGDTAFILESGRFIWEFRI